MQQYTFCLKSPESLDAVLDELKSTCPKNYSTMLVSILSGCLGEQVVCDLAAKVAKALPKACITASSTSGEILNGLLAVETTMLHCMVFSDAQLVVDCIDFQKVSPEEGAALLVSKEKSSEHVAGIELLVAVNDPRTYTFLAHLRDIPKHVPIFGGVAGTNTDQETFIFANGQLLHEGVVAVTFLGADLHIQVNSTEGWIPLGPWFRITAMGEDNVITELDGRPAALVYEKYLGIPREELKKETLLFPLFLERNGRPFLRLPTSATVDGALVMGADCMLGERVRLAYGDPEAILDAQGDMRKAVKDFAPQALSIFNCVTRRFFLNRSSNNALQPLQQIAPCTGFYTGGEIARTRDGETTLLNMTLVSAAFREGKKVAVEAEQDTLQGESKRALTGTLKLVQYLTHFIMVTSKELEEANAILFQQAITDKLTRLYNRGEIERIIQQELSNRRKSDRPVSAIMLDIDDFKKVNDVYGHSIGDEVLQWAGTVLRNSIRRYDAAGRWGGEEFFVLLPGEELSFAKTVAERIRKAFMEGYALPDGKKVTVSLGVAQYRAQCSYMDFYRSLDAALYKAKKEGKNRYCLAEAVPPSEESSKAS